MAVEGPLIRVVGDDGAETGAQGSPSVEMVERRMPDLDYRDVDASGSGGYRTTKVWTVDPHPRPRRAPGSRARARVGDTRAVVFRPSLRR